MKLLRYNFLWVGLVLALLLASCSTTKNLPEGETLYSGIKAINYTNKDKSANGVKTMEEIEAAISIAPNNSFFGSATMQTPLPLGLWIWNGFQHYKKGVGRWFFNSFAADPVLLSSVNPDTRVKVAASLLKDYGYFDGSINYTVDTLKNPRAVKLTYNIDMGHPYLIDTITYEGFNARMDSLLHDSINYSERLVHSGDNFDVTVLGSEKDRVNSVLRNNGYYYSRSSFINILADTIMHPGYVNLKVVPKIGRPAEADRIYYIGHTTVKMIGYDGAMPTDTLHTPYFTVCYSGDRPPLRFPVMRRRFLYRTGEIYSEQRQTYSQNALTNLGIFKFSEFTYTPRGESDTLDIFVNSMFDQPYDVELEFNVTNKSTKQTGPGAIFTLSRKNFRRMGATLNLELNASYEWQTSSTVDGEESVMNSYEFGAALSLDFPRLMLPWAKYNNVRSFRYPGKTSFKIYIDQLNRAKYFKMLSFGGSVTYSFQRSRSWKHTVTPLDLTFNHLQHRTATFDSISAANPNLFLSLDDQFIPAMRYTITYDNTWRQKLHRIWWEASVASAGNLTSLAFAAFGRSLSEQEKELFGTPFAQFLKATTELRYLYNMSDKQQIAARVMAGVIWSYGNKTIAPYSEQFYVGGANSIRAFTVRSIGPGSFHPADGTTYSYVDQTGDIKFEANVEWRFRMMTGFLGGNLNGALFVDAGNVWLMREDEARPGAKFTLDKFFDTLALGTGVGIRYDLSFLILRLDWGIALHVPYDTGKSGYYNIPKFWDGCGLHFAIGYPF